ncbi:MAG: hypothetical protein ACO1O1_00825 [Adhaeribacter sp.]
MMVRVLYLFIFCTLLGSCRPEEAVPTFPLESPVEVEIKEILLEGKKHVVLSCRTKKIYDCSNNYLKVSMQQAAGQVTVSFLGITGDRLCLSALGPARADLDLGQLPNGQYQLKLNGLEANQGTLTVTDTTIQLSFSQPQGIEIVNPVFNR